MLADAPKTSAHLWRISKPLVRQIESPDGVISIDDSLSEKLYIDENNIICWHWKNQAQPLRRESQALSVSGQIGLPERVNVKAQGASA